MLKMIAFIIGILALSIPFLFCIFRRSLRSRGIGPAKEFYIAVFITWLVMVFSIFLSNTMLEWRIDSFDIDGDGMINPSEMTVDARKSLDDFANDSPGSGAYPYFVIVGSLLWCSLIFSVIRFIKWVITCLFRGQPTKSNPV